MKFQALETRRNGIVVNNVSAKVPSMFAVTWRCLRSGLPAIQPQHVQALEKKETHDR